MSKFPTKIVTFSTEKVDCHVLAMAQGISEGGLVGHDATVYLTFAGERRDYMDAENNGEYTLTIKRGSGERIQFIGTTHLVRVNGVWRTFAEHPRNPFMKRELRGVAREEPGKRDTEYLWTALFALCGTLDEHFLMAGQLARLTDDLERARAKEEEAKAAYDKARATADACGIALYNFQGPLTLP